MKVAIQGYSGSFHALAAQKYFGTMPDLVMCDSFANLFKALQHQEAQLAVMAIENTIAGSILFNYSLLRNSDFVIAGETFLRIEHCLMAMPGQSIEMLHEVRSHPMALMQCMNFFNKYHHIKLVEDIDTALMAQLIASEKRLGVAAIAGKNVAEAYGLEIVQNNIEDTPQNFTRFLVLSKTQIHDGDNNKATICFNIPNQKGALLKILQIVHDENINVCNIQTNPYVGNAWEYYFIMDLTFDDEKNFDTLTPKLSSHCSYFKLLGKYKKEI